MGKMKTKPPHQPTDEIRKKVEFLAGFGMTHQDIALMVDMSPPTLRKYYSDELNIGKVKATAQVAKTLFQQATKPEKPNMSAAIFWLKCQAGWKEQQAEIPGKKEAKQDAAERIASDGKFKPRLVK